MRKVLKHLLITLLAFVAVSCATTPVTGSAYTAQENALLRARQSFVKVHAAAVITLCSGTKCVTMAMPGRSSTGSGAVVKHGKDNSLILTAAHVCDALRGLTKKAKEEFKAVARYEVTTLLGKSYEAKVVKVEKAIALDMCLLTTAPIPVPALRVAKSPPKILKNYHNFAATRGVFDKNMVLHFTGKFSGYTTMRGDLVALFTFPLEGGSSGSPVLNEYGKLVGMVHHMLRNFKNVALCTTWADIVAFLP